ncbi:hypothetical protein ABW21_db0207796 [Orbilia brochopaga]|nr:hypothetical protein ABW21_db0207796 [Drechslerella brochopaga]
MNGAPNGDFGLREGSDFSALAASLSETETTVTVNWSGGGQIKPDGMAWTLDNLMSVAASFPSKVAACPQRTWAILTKYDKNPSFVEWKNTKAKGGLKILHFSAVQQYTADLLDMYMVYKNNLEKLQAVMLNLTAYRLSSSSSPVSLTIESLVEERTKIKAEMRKIAGVIDELNKDPSVMPTITVKSPEVWATRLPVLKSRIPSSAFNKGGMVDLLSGFSIIDDEPPVKPRKDERKSQQQPVEVITPAVAAKICSDPDAFQSLNPAEKEFVNHPSNQLRYRNYRFGKIVGQGTGESFNDVKTLEKNSLVKAAWPEKISFGFQDEEGVPILQYVEIVYEKLLLSHGIKEEGCSPIVEIDLAHGKKKVTEYILGEKKNNTPGFGRGFCYLEFNSDDGELGPSNRAGEIIDIDRIVSKIANDAIGLKGFWGTSNAEDGRILRLGPIWGLEPIT